MIIDKSKYIVYFRNGEYHVCKECYKNMLQADEIIEDNMEYFEATQLSSNMNWNIKLNN